MLTVKSIGREMAEEDAAAKRDTRHQEQLLYGTDATGGDDMPDDDDGTMVAGDQDNRVTHIHNPPPASALSSLKDLIMPLIAAAGIGAAAYLAGKGDDATPPPAGQDLSGFLEPDR